MTFTPEQMNKAKSAKSAEELLEMAKAEGVAMTADEAAKYFADLHTEGELNEDELATIAGGKGDPPPPKYWIGQELYIGDNVRTLCTVTNIWGYVDKTRGYSYEILVHKRNAPDYTETVNEYILDSVYSTS